MNPGAGVANDSAAKLGRGAATAISAEACVRSGVTSSGTFTAFVADAGGNGAKIDPSPAAALVGDDEAAARSGGASCAIAGVVLPSRIKVTAKKLFIAFLKRFTSGLWEKPPYYGKQQRVLLSTFFVGRTKKLGATRHRAAIPKC